MNLVPGAFPHDQTDTLVTVLDLVRAGAARTRPELIRASGLGRTVVTQRVAQLLDAGLLDEKTVGPSTGGRAPRALRFCAEAGYILVAELGATSVSVALADLSGALHAHREELASITEGPEPILSRVDEMFRAALADHDEPVPIWGVGIGLPGPVEFATGKPVAPPIMPGWDGADVRSYFASRYDVPVWADNDVNVMALGELRGGVARSVRDLVYVKVGTGIGAGLVSGGRLHRGAQGCAGDIGHMVVEQPSEITCRCGNNGCLEALAGGQALARDGVAAGRSGRSGYLARLLAAGHAIEAVDVSAGAHHGDRACVELLSRSATLVGEAVASIVNFFNPALILIGGGVSESGDSYLATVRQAVLRTSLPLATRSLEIARSPVGVRAGLMGAAFIVIDELFSRERIGAWIDDGNPVGQPRLAEPGAATPSGS
jgi:glucokinase-like ROK family protein